MSPLVVHIAQNRYDAIVAQGYKVRFSPEKWAALPKGDVEYHTLDGERGLCDMCGAEFDSVDANTPAELDNIKWQMEGELPS